MLEWKPTKKISRVTGWRSTIGCFVGPIKLLIYRKSYGWAFTTIFDIEEVDLRHEYASRKTYGVFDTAAIDCINAGSWIAYDHKLDYDPDDIPRPTEPQPPIVTKSITPTVMLRRRFQ